MKISLVATDGGAQLAMATAAASGGGLVWLSSIKELALELFGVPLPIVLAATAGSFGALSFMAGMGYLKTLRNGVIWTLVGTYGGQLGLFLFRVFLEWLLGRAVEIPAGVLGGMALVIAGAGPLLMTPENIQKAREAVGRYLDRIGAKT